MSTEKKLIVVLGATGYQGGAVVQTFLKHPSYRVRAITRDPTSAKGHELSAAGAEVVKADLDDTGSLSAAFTGANAIYLVTNFFDDLSQLTREFEQGKRAADVAATIPTLEHFVWSALPSVTDATGGKYTHVFHFDSKAQVTDYIRTSQPALWKKTTVLWLPGYYQIWYQFPDIFGVKKAPDGVWEQRSSLGPETVAPSVDVRETGKVVKAILGKGDALGGKIVAAVGEEKWTQVQGLQFWGKVVNREVRYKFITPEEQAKDLEGLGLPDFLVKDMVDVLSTFREYGTKIVHGPDVVQASEILPEGEKLKNWEEFLLGEDWEPYLQR